MTFRASASSTLGEGAHRGRVHTTAEGEHRWALPHEVEAIGMVVHRRVAVGGRGVGHHIGAGRDANTAQFDVGGRHTKRGEHNRRAAHELLDRSRREFGMFGEQHPLVRVIGQHLHGGGQLVTCGVGARVEQDRDEIDQLVVADPVAVFFGRG